MQNLMKEKTVRIYLTGFMTSGKSTIGPILANVLGWKYADLDRVIESAENLEITSIFEQKGEKYFRETEEKHLDAVSCEEEIVISLGGGTMNSEKNRQLIKQKGLLIYLEASEKTIFRRLRNKIDRPIFRDLVLDESPEADFQKRINQLMKEREAYYRLADISMRTDLSPIGVTVDSLVKKVSRKIYG